MILSTSDTEENYTGVIITPVEEEIKRSYLDYSMSVIVSRAIPDVRDGLKPVHRRILFAMSEASLNWNKPHKKSARIVGDVMAKYHPHGDAAIYDSLVRMAQPFSLEVPLIDGQGNFGSMDGDPPAAMRYTESKLTKAAHLMIDEIDKETVTFQENYDGSEREPVVLPAKFPNILVNGAGGIAVGMATNIPTHNLGEVIDACCAYIDNFDIQDEELLEIVKGPDFPTGGIIMGNAGIRSALLTGRGSIKIRGRAEVETKPNGASQIIITEIPYQVNKAKMIEKIADLVREKRIEGISDLRDESNKNGVRVVIEVKKDAFADVILSQIYSYTPLQTSFGVNMLALDHGKPKLMNLREVIASFIEFREVVTIKKITFLLRKARERAHILVGLFVAVENIDEVIALIKGSKDPVEAREKLLEKNWIASKIQDYIELVGEENNEVNDGRCYLTETQARAILEMRLQRLTGLEKERIESELTTLANEIKEHLDILASRDRLLSIIKNDLSEIKLEFATPRKTEIDLNEFNEDAESLIPREDMVVTVTLGGYIKRVPLSTYKSQKRGGKGRSAITVRDEDVTTNVFIADTHTPVLFFSNIGKVYKLKVYKLPIATPQSKGRSLVNIFPLAENEYINQFMPLPEDEDLWDNLFIFFSTKLGNVRRNSLSDFRSVQSNGKIAMKLEENDMLIGVSCCNDSEHIFLASKNGQCVRFPVTAVRVFKGRNSDGVRGMRLSEGDEVVCLSIIRGLVVDSETRDQFLKIPLEIRQNINALEDADLINEELKKIETTLDSNTVITLSQQEQFIITATANGFGKRTSAYEYRVTNRGGSGVVNIITSDRNGLVVSSMLIEKSDQIILITNKGMIIRCPVKDIRITSRNTQGVGIFKTADSEYVVSSARIEMLEEEQSDDVENLEADHQDVSESTTDALAQEENLQISSDDTPDNAAEDDQ